MSEGRGNDGPRWRAVDIMSARGLLRVLAVCLELQMHALGDLNLRMG